MEFHPTYNLNCVGWIVGFVKNSYAICSLFDMNFSFGILILIYLKKKYSCTKNPSDATFQTYQKKKAIITLI